MKHVIYFSTAVNEFNETSLADLAGYCAEHNADAGITGMLVYNAGCFLQVLEGPEDVVDAIMTKIRSDERHVWVTTIVEGPATQRLFPDWQMGLVHFGDSPFVMRDDFEIITRFVQAMDGAPTEIIIKALLRYYYQRAYSGEGVFHPDSAAAALHDLVGV
ncbi:MAG: BLUF domain-containing protein [Planctomycetota bacterium]